MHLKSADRVTVGGIRKLSFESWNFPKNFPIVSVDPKYRRIGYRFAISSRAACYSSIRPMNPRMNPIFGRASFSRSLLFSRPVPIKNMLNLLWFPRSYQHTYLPPSVIVEAMRKTTHLITAIRKTKPRTKRSERNVILLLSLNR